MQKNSQRVLSLTKRARRSLSRYVGFVVDALHHTLPTSPPCRPPPSPPPWALLTAPSRAGQGWGKSTRGLYSFTSQLNLSALYGIGGARRGCAAGVRGCQGVFRLCRVFSCVRHGSSSAEK